MAISGRILCQYLMEKFIFVLAAFGNFYFFSKKGLERFNIFRRFLEGLRFNVFQL